MPQRDAYHSRNLRKQARGTVESSRCKVKNEKQSSERKKESYFEKRKTNPARKCELLSFFSFRCRGDKWPTHQDGQHDVLEVIPQVGGVGAEENKVALHQLEEGER